MTKKEKVTYRAWLMVGSKTGERKAIAFPIEFEATEKTLQKEIKKQKKLHGAEYADIADLKLKDAKITIIDVKRK